MGLSRLSGRRLPALWFAGAGAEVLAPRWILGLVGIEVDFAHATFVFALAMLAGAPSMMPGGRDSNDAVMSGLLVVAAGLPADTARVALVPRPRTPRFAVLLGLAALMACPRGEHT
jgi:uncharacterized membrane protein YbhN (UPF0104 family)